MKRRTFLILLILTILSVVGSSVNAEFETHSSQSFSTGSITFEQALASATNAINGQVAMAEFKAKEGLPVYEFEIISPEGSVWNVEIHGNTGLVIDLERHVSLDDATFESQSDISVNEAESIALAFMPGTVNRSEYLFDASGFAVYEFAVDSDIGGSFKFEINAQTGEIQSTSQVLWQVGSASAQPASNELSLYERLGGVDAIRAVVSNFAQRLFDDPELEPFFGALNEQRQQRFIDLNVDFLCQAAGGPCTYTGRSMFDAHQGLGTTNDIFNVVVQHLIDTLDEFNVPDRERREILALIETTREDIVEE